MVDSVSNERLFPTLSTTQITRASPHGRTRNVKVGEVLVEPDSPNTRFYIVQTAQLEIVHASGAAEHFVTSLGPGQFTGEFSFLAGRRAVVRISVSKSGDLIEIEREKLLALLQTDSELSDILMRALILRRVELISRGYGDLTLLGSAHSPGTLRIKEFLTRNGQPYSYID